MFKELLANLGNIFSSNHIPYMIIGGQAVLLYGEPRLTKDIDVNLGIPPAASQKIISLLKPLGIQSMVDDQFVQKTLVMPCLQTETHIRIDLIFSFSAFEKEVIARSKKIAINGVEVSFISLNDLIIYKIISGRPRDIEDIGIVMMKNKKELDLPFIESTLQMFSLSLSTDFSDIFEQLKKRFGL